MIAESRSIDALPRSSVFESQLAIAVQHVTNLLPVNQILRVEDGHTREILERGVDEIEVAAYPANARIRMETRDDRIAQLC